MRLNKPVPSIKNAQLRVLDIETIGRFYQGLLNLSVLEDSKERRVLHNATGFTLTLNQAKRSKKAQQSGLYHHAFLLSSLDALNQHVNQVLVPINIPFGSSDHGVSIAFYLQDPEGNGIEVYADKDVYLWPFDHKGKLEMVSDPVDVNALIKQGKTGNWDGQVNLGHVHLRGINVSKMKDFYTLLGYDLTQEMQHAVFMSTDNYHHHIAFNSWSFIPLVSHDNEASDVDCLEVWYKNQEALTSVILSLNVSGFSVRKFDDYYEVYDPSGIPLKLKQESK